MTTLRRLHPPPGAVSVPSLTHVLHKPPPQFREPPGRALPLPGLTLGYRCLPLKCFALTVQRAFTRAQEGAPATPWSSLHSGAEGVGETWATVGLHNYSPFPLDLGGLDL